jgi:hypothetical protein
MSDWGPFMNKSVPRRVIRMIRPRPFLHERTTVSMWWVLLAVVLIIDNMVGDGWWLDHLLGFAAWGIMITAVAQWLWWSRRGRARD